MGVGAGGEGDVRELETALDVVEIGQGKDVPDSFESVGLAVVRVTQPSLVRQDRFGLSGDGGGAVNDERFDAATHAPESDVGITGPVSRGKMFGYGMDLPEGFEVVTLEALSKYIGVHHLLELATGVVAASVVDGGGGEGMGKRPSEGHGGRERVAVADGVVGALEEFGGFVLVELDCSHLLRVCSLKSGGDQLVNWIDG